MDSSSLNRPLNTWTDLSGFNQLRMQAKADEKSALPAVAKQFEALFTQMMLKSMREANAALGEDTLGGSEAGHTYQSMFDQQLSLSLSNTPHGLGIARLLVKQLGGTPEAQTAAPHVGAGQPLLGTLATAGEAGVRALLNLGGDAPTGETAQTFQPLTADTGTRSWRSTFSDLAGDAAKVVGQVQKFFTGGDPVAFVQAVAPSAQAAAHRLGVSVRALLAQAALETGWGKHLPTRPDGSSSFNLFGIKAGSHWDGDRVHVPTLEYENGVAVRKQDSFRAYDSPADSFGDYATLIANSPRYAGAVGQGDNIEGFAHALVEGGYATDPSYAAKIVAIARSPAMDAALAQMGWLK